MSMLRRRGFTLIELMVVVAIIVILATTSLALIAGLTNGGEVKAGGSVTWGAFAKGRQQAASQRATIFLVFIDATDSATGMATGTIEVHKDADRNNTYEPGIDPIQDAPIVLPKGVRFHLPGAGGYPSPAAPAWLAVLPDGSIVPDGNFFPVTGVSSAAFDSDFATGRLNPGNSDLCIEQSSGLPGKLYCNIARPTGRLRKLVYWNN